MKYRHILGLSGATILAVFLFISIAAFDLPKIPGGGATDTIKALPVPDSVKPSVSPSLMASIGNTIYNWEVGRREKETDLEVTKQMLDIFDRLKKVALADEKYGEVAKTMDWRLTTIRDKETVMAKVVSGGGVAIYEGVFKVAQFETALAAILGHEMAHVLARHELNRLTGDVAATALTLGPLIASGTTPDKMDPKVIGPVAGAMGVGYLFGVRQIWKHEQELEADELGLLLAAKAGFDPEAITGFWRRMNSDATKVNNEFPFLHDHPITKERLTFIENTCMPKSKKVYDQYDEAKSGKRPKPLATLPGVIG